MALNNTYFETKGKDVTTPIPDTPGYLPPSPPTPPTPGSGDIPVIPRPTFSGSVDCTLYVNSSENNALDKNLTSVVTDTLVFKEDVDMMNPVIVFQTSTDLTGVNYMKLNNKYYFVHIECIKGGRYTIYGHVDVLTTYKDQIRLQVGIIRRNANSYNRYLQDDKIKMNAYEQVKTLQFPSGFSKTLQYYLVTIGGASSE